MPGVWNQQEFVTMIRSEYQMSNPLEPHKEKRVLMNISFLSCVPHLFSYFYSILPFDSAPLARWQLLLCMWPSFLIFFSSMLWEMIFGRRVNMKGGRKYQLPCSVVWICVSYQMLQIKYSWVGAPPWTDRGSCRVYSQYFISSFNERIVNKREKLEFGW